jgi:hypothetical protein
LKGGENSPFEKDLSKMHENNDLRVQEGLKALTLTQPWASLVALREKTIETRSWYTAYRGELVIHAAKGFPGDAQALCERPHFTEALRGLTAKELPLSRGLCVVKVRACIKTNEMYKVRAILGHQPTLNEMRFGNYEPGRFAWVLQYVRPIEDGESVRGFQRLWNWPAGANDRVAA